MTHSILRADSSNALEVLARAVRLRASGDSFDLELHLDDDRGSVAAALAQNVCRAYPQPNDERLAALDRLGSPEAAIGENPLLRFATMDVATKATIRDLAALADSLIVRSWAEMRRGVMDFDIVHRAYSVAVQKDERVPQRVTRGAGDGSLVIWAPDEPVERLYIVLAAAARTGRRLRIVAKRGDLAGIPGEVIAPEDSADALGRAAACVVASLSDPSAAIALVPWNIPLCATFTSGAQEWISPVCSYRSWSVASAFAAITQALAMPPPVYQPSSAQHLAVSQECKRDALVTLIVRSQDGSVCDATRRSVQAQTHASYEVMVAGTAREVREALAAANGSYVLFLDDGDALFADHLASLVDALETSGAGVAYAGGVLGYTMDAPGPATIFGYSVMEQFPLRYRALAAVDEFSETYFRVLFRCEPLKRAGLHRELDMLAIYEVLLRMLAQEDAVHVNRVTGMSFRLLDGRRPMRAPRSYRTEYETCYRMHPAPDASVEDARAAVLRHLTQHAQIGLRPPPQRL